jgi:hypothetical protein
VTGQGTLPLDGLTTADTPTEPPAFDYAGANLGGQSLHTCGACSSLVQESAISQHIFWHTKVDLALKALIGLGQ